MQEHFSTVKTAVCMQEHFSTVYDSHILRKALMNALSDMFQLRGIQREKIKSLLEQKLVLASYPDYI